QGRRSSPGIPWSRLREPSGLPDPRSSPGPSAAPRKPPGCGARAFAAAEPGGRMSKLAWLAEQLSERRVARQTSAYLASLAQEPVLASRRNVRELLQILRNEPGPKVCLGETMGGGPVVVPLMERVKACGIATGGMGSGKTVFAGLILDEIGRASCRERV